MNTQQCGGPAFPPSNPHTGETGMSLRDWFAGKALQGLLSCEQCFENMSDEAISRNAYNAADAMLTAREAPSALEEDVGRTVFQERSVKFLVKENNVVVLETESLAEAIEKYNELT